MLLSFLFLSYPHNSTFLTLYDSYFADTTTSAATRRSYDSYNDSMYSNSPYSGSRYGSNYGSRYGSNYGGYGSSYGNSYGNSYGSYGSGYGSSLNSYGSGYGGYGSSYGGYGSYGSGYGSYGNSFGDYGGGYGGYGGYGGGYGSELGKYGPPAAGQSGFFQGAAHQGFQFVNGFHSVTANVGRFAGLLDANSQAMHGVLSSIVRLIENAGFLYREIGFALSGFTVVRLIQRLVRRIFGRKANANKANTSPGALEAVNEFQKENGGGTSTTRFWFTFIVAVVSCAFFGIPLLNRAVGRWLGPEEDEKALNDAWGGNNPAGVIQVRAMHDYPAQNEHELSIRQGDIIEVVKKPFEAWWEGEIIGQPGRSGLFPTNYTQPITDPNTPSEPQLRA